MRQNIFQYAIILLAGSFLFASILPAGLNAGYSDRYATDFPIDRAESICNDQIKEIGGYMKSTRIALQRYTYCSSPTRLRGVQNSYRIFNDIKSGIVLNEMLLRYSFQTNE
ncbi:hypothetical protein H6769_07760 [Candidatus Peribacteria bacterium]|nr:hypothetical protein [Candidatus Peribacteria bacterium]